ASQRRRCREQADLDTANDLRSDRYGEAFRRGPAALGGCKGGGRGHPSTTSPMRPIASARAKPPPNWLADDDSQKIRARLAALQARSGPGAAYFRTFLAPGPIRRRHPELTQHLPSALLCWQGRAAATLCCWQLLATVPLHQGLRPCGPASGS